MTRRASAVASRRAARVWPHFGDRLRLDGRVYYLVGVQHAPQRAFLIRLDGVSEASAKDVFLPLSAWPEFQWDAHVHQWRRP